MSNNIIMTDLNSGEIKSFENLEDAMDHIYSKKRRGCSFKIVSILLTILIIATIIYFWRF